MIMNQRISFHTINVLFSVAFRKEDVVDMESLKNLLGSSSASTITKEAIVALAIIIGFITLEEIIKASFIIGSPDP